MNHWPKEIFIGELLLYTKCKLINIFNIFRKDGLNETIKKSTNEKKAFHKLTGINWGIMSIILRLLCLTSALVIFNRGPGWASLLSKADVFSAAFSCRCLLDTLFFYPKRWILMYFRSISGLVIFKERIVCTLFFCCLVAFLLIHLAIFALA